MTFFAQSVVFRLCPVSEVGITSPWGFFPCCACTAYDRMLAVVVLLEASIAVAHAVGGASLALWTGLGPRSLNDEENSQQGTTITMAIASASASAPASASAAAATPASACASASWPKSPLK